MIAYTRKSGKTIIVEMPIIDNGIHGTGRFEVNEDESLFEVAYPEWLALTPGAVEINDGVLSRAVVSLAHLKSKN